MADKKNDKFTWKKGDIVWEKRPQKPSKSPAKSTGNNKGNKKK